MAEDSPNRWEHAIRTVDATPIYTDGSRVDNSIVRGGYYQSQGKLGVRVGKVATVWDGDIVGLEKGILAAANREWKILLLSGSKAAIQAIMNAGVLGRASIQGLA